ncbi:YecA family protein [Sporosarcina sp. HYO08]|uniref:YecA family protein n=1 Tax=Sporosarcina sp. HYO08 TaxID=1759557 RepID=UPI0007970389|nr:SEC-C metal-binding domain-containing protein [Sporosarcina sp. HYO08]KXH81877.1 metal-binding protein [Sporosarcina sp. HYO08]
MVGRNDPCPCGSGKKYKKCCAGKETVSIADVTAEELEAVLQTFYEVHPDRGSVRDYLNLVNEWKTALGTDLEEEMIEAIGLDEFFFHHQPEIWTKYLDRQRKKIIRPSVENVLKNWYEPSILIGEVKAVHEDYLTVDCIFTGKTNFLRRESGKPVPEGVHVYCFTLPDGTAQEDHYLAISSLVFIPTDHQKVFDELVKQFNAQGEVPTAFMQQNGLAFWKMLCAEGYGGDEFTNFESGVLSKVTAFLNEKGQDPDKLLEVIEDYLVEQQPNARKDVAIAAGAIRFGVEQQLIEPLEMTIKQIAEWFEISPSSLNKYYHELNAYYEQYEPTI